MTRVVTFYLPQFHAIPENDEWWGEGFTEWTNVGRAIPLFDHHYHPKEPGSLGAYDLLDDGVIEEQIRLARGAGVDAFCVYYYWFNGKRLLEKPLDVLTRLRPGFPFCISWANEQWTRRWDGKEHEVLMPQTYPNGYEEAVFADMLPYIKSANYLRVGDRPALLVHRATHLPDARRTAAVWRALAVKAGLPGLYLVASETQRGMDPAMLGFDALAEFPPVGSNTIGTARLAPPQGLDPRFRGRLMSYPRMARSFMRRQDPPFVRHAGVAPRWDNTARRQWNATVYADESPNLYAAWLRHARDRESRLRASGGLVFVNAWNEWAEGAYLEPDLRDGDAYLRATRGELVPERSGLRSRSPTLGYWKSLGRASLGSCLNAWRIWSSWVKVKVRGRNGGRRDDHA